MAVDSIKLEFTNAFDGIMHTPKTDLLIGNQEKGISPYNLLFGALGSCFYATFLDVIKKMRLSYKSATVEIKGTKREEVPTTLKYVEMILIITEASNHEKIKRAAELGAKYCSIHETISKVAVINLQVEFID